MNAKYTLPNPRFPLTKRKKNCNTDGKNIISELWANFVGMLRKTDPIWKKFIIIVDWWIFSQASEEEVEDFLLVDKAMMKTIVSNNLS